MKSFCVRFATTLVQANMKHGLRRVTTTFQLRQQKQPRQKPRQEHWLQTFICCQQDRAEWQSRSNSSQHKLLDGITVHQYIKSRIVSASSWLEFTSTARSNSCNSSNICDVCQSHCHSEIRCNRTATDFIQALQLSPRINCRSLHRSCCYIKAICVRRG